MVQMVKLSHGFEVVKFDSVESPSLRGNFWSKEYNRP